MYNLWNVSGHQAWRQEHEIRLCSVQYGSPGPGGTCWAVSCSTAARWLCFTCCTLSCSTTSLCFYLAFCVGLQAHLCMATSPPAAPSGQEPNSSSSAPTRAGPWCSQTRGTTKPHQGGEASQIHGCQSEATTAFSELLQSLFSRWRWNVFSVKSPQGTPVWEVNGGVSTAALEQLESWGSNHEHHPAAKRSEAPGQAQAQLKHQRRPSPGASGDRSHQSPLLQLQQKRVFTWKTNSISGWKKLFICELGNSSMWQKWTAWWIDSISQNGTIQSVFN